LSVILSSAIYGQDLSNFIRKDISAVNDTVIVDTLSIVPESLEISVNGVRISKADYEINYAKAIVVFKKDIFEKIKNNNCEFSYRVFPYNFSKSYFHKSYNSNNENIKRRYIVDKEAKENSSDSRFAGLKKSGSISRGITFGNNQDASLNSDFNLQLSGKISPDVEIQANISDSNLPVQADGTSQNLREFDNVYIRLLFPKSLLTVGDFVSKSETGYFLNYKKKVQGAAFKTNFSTGKFKAKTHVNASISKGIFNRETFNGREGDSGPYRLKGKNGELYIIVLSGSERIYLDGILLKRGNENDYVINYNTGELTFTSKHIITKDSRIIAEFEYSEMNYTRFNYGGGISFKSEKSFWFANFISEIDAKNQTIMQDLSDEQKLILENAGDDTENAFIPDIVYVDDFTGDEVLYGKKDTVVNGVIYEDIYFYSADSLTAKYRLQFSFVGEGKGNYVRLQSEVNGKVFEWKAPENGILQGSYEPVRLLVTPKKKQMLTAGGRGKIKKSADWYFETAMSDYDKNLFSSKNDADNISGALRVGLSGNLLKRDTSETFLKLAGDYGFTGKHFEAFEPYKSPEFARDWNLPFFKNVYDEHFISAGISYFNKRTGRFSFNSEFLSETEFYKGNKNTVSINIKKKNILFNLNADRLTAEDTALRSEFIRYNAIIEAGAGKLKYGFSDSGEKNVFKNISNEEMNPASFRFNEFKIYIKTAEDIKNKFSVSYTNREDFLPYANELSYSATAHNFKLSGVFTNFKNQKIKMRFNYRKLSGKNVYLDNLPDNTLSARFEYAFAIFNKALYGSVFAEHTGGNEPAKEFTYIEVQNGQGIFAWKDFNNNGIKELNEFVKANFSDEADFVRVALPSVNYETVYNQNAYISLNMQPGRFFKKNNGKTKKVFSGLSNNFFFKINRKINEKAGYFNYSVPDSLLTGLNKNLKNRLSYKIPVLSLRLSYTFIKTESRNLLINGTDIRGNMFHVIEINKKTSYFMIKNSFKTGEKTYLSEFFPDNNYISDYSENTSVLSYKPDNFNTVSGNFTVKSNKNISGEEEMSSWSAGAEYKFSSTKKGRFSVKFDFVNIEYSGNSNTFTAYEFLGGLQPGKNFLWTVSRYVKLTDYLQLELNYSGRKPGDEKVVHTGGMSLRAFF